jgi:hypothetical protein
MVNSLRNNLEVVRSSRSEAEVPIKTMTLLFPPPYTCNNQAFNGTKSIQRDQESYLKANICITTSMTKEMMSKTLTDLAKETIGETDMVAMDTDETEEDTSRDGKRKRTLVVKNSKDFARALKTLQQFVMERVDFCVYVVFQMVIDTYTKRQLYKADDDDTADVNKLFSDINIG